MLVIINDPAALPDDGLVVVIGGPGTAVDGSVAVAGGRPGCYTAFSLVHIVVVVVFEALSDLAEPIAVSFVLEAAPFEAVGALANKVRGRCPVSHGKVLVEYYTRRTSAGVFGRSQAKGDHRFRVQRDI